MAANDWTTAAYPGAFNVAPLAGDNETIVFNRTIDCAVTALTSADTYKLFIIPAGYTLINLVTTCLTAEGAAESIDLGDSAGATTFHNDLSLNSVAATAGSVITKHYASADYIVALANAALTVAKFNVTAVFVKPTTKAG